MATDNTEQIVSQPNDLEPQDTQQSETPQLAQTLVDLNQTMSHMAMMLGDLWQKSQDTNVVSLQQPDVEESQHRRRGKKRRSKTSSSSSEASSGSGNESRGRKRRKRRSHSKTRLENRGETTDHEQDKVSVHVQDDDDNVSVLLQDGATNDNTNSTDETLTNLGEMLEDVEATGDDITPKLL
ncbi:Hypothetical predicted protein [Paramuricea clavata]|uniref:Uncharacterized protein n=1 Tax=Paramuricea clavata TaxID=317549 RepID=A0A6S7KF72_PARCT|nr:Hypothetical predicted protein [Paramuricea clavata]